MAATADKHTPAFKASPTPFSSLPAGRSPDQLSTVFPDRHIRPLPKTRLLARLSPEQAASIDFSKHRQGPQIKGVFPFESEVATTTYRAEPPQQENRAPNGTVGHAQYLHHHLPTHHDPSAHTHCTCGEDLDSGDDEVEFDHPDYRYTTPTPSAGGDDKPLSGVQRRLMEAARVPSKAPPPPGSAASSADGYESFENTSNKKKRKIPLSGTATNQNQLSAEMASMGISGGLDGASDDINGAVPVQQEYTPSPTSTGKGISGAGRGRYGRGEARRPLANSNINLSNGWTRVASGSDAASKNSIKSSVKGEGADAGIENAGGIISQAIKTAAQQGPLTTQDKSSLLRAVQNPTPTTPGNPKTQFTFTMESESANKFIENQAQAQHEAAQRAAASYANPRASAGKAGPAPMSNQSTQTSQSIHNGSSNAGGSRSGRPPPLPNNGSHMPASQPGDHPSPPPRARRSKKKEYEVAARTRRLQQEYTNYHHRPSVKDNNIWICEFCEYEDIFGVAPVALIRQYEIKDRRERKRAEEKRRLLEKAKAKGRKGRKGSKKNSHNSNKAVDPLTGAASTAGPGGQAYNPDMLPADGGEVDDYYPDDDYDDEFGPPNGAYGDEYDPAEYEIQEQERAALRAEAARKIPPAGKRGGKVVK